MVLSKRQQEAALTVVEYPLKVVEIDEFFLNFDSLVWQRLTRTYSSNQAAVSKTTVNERSKAAVANCYTSCCGNIGGVGQHAKLQIHNSDEVASSLDDENVDEIRLVDKETNRPIHSTHQTHTAHKPCLGHEYNVAQSSLTLLFIDSDLLRLNFEKSHLKLVNNIIVLDRLD